MLSQMHEEVNWDIPKKRGRPKTTGRGEGVLVRLHKHQIAALDEWIATLDPPTDTPRSDAAHGRTGSSSATQKELGDRAFTSCRGDVLESVCKLGYPTALDQRRAAGTPTPA